MKMPASYTPSTLSQVDISKMRLIYFNNEFPFDSLQELFRGLHNLSKQRRYGLLARFLDEATVVVREEVRILP